MTPILRFFYFPENISFLKITLPTFLCFNILKKSWNVYFHLVLDWSNAAWPIWWLNQSTKRCQLNESVVAITNMSCVYLLTCIWLFCFLKAQKCNLSLTLALNYTKATRSRVGLVRYPFQILILCMACSWNLHQRYFLKKMLFSGVIPFDPCIFHKSGIISADISIN